MSNFFKKLTPNKEKQERKKRRKTEMESSPETTSPGGSGQYQYVNNGQGQDIGDILAQMNVKLDKLNIIESTVKDLQNSMTEAMKTADEAKSLAKTSHDKCAQLENFVAELKDENKKLHSELNNVKEQGLRMESQSRRNNLNFDGVKEEKEEKPSVTLAKIRAILGSMTIPNPGAIVIERCHRRAGPKGKPRPIIVKFNSYNDRDLVWQNRDSRADKTIWIRQDFPKEYEDRRAKLKPILRAAKSDDRYKGKEVYLSVDKLSIDGKLYRHDEMEKLPDGLRPDQIATRVANNMTLFFHKESPFSNFHPAKFVIDGQSYSSAEQFFQSKKAEYFNDDLTRSKIMATDDPHQQYILGRKVKDFDEKKWRPGPAIKFMEEGLTAKFNQNEHLMKALRSTQGTDLVECSPNDLFWGTGISLFHGHATETSRWLGQNRLGTLLSVVRQKFMHNT